MGLPLEQNLFDPEIGIRCHGCERSCPADAISHDDGNVVVDAVKCRHRLNRFTARPTGSIGNRQAVTETCSLKRRLHWPEIRQATIAKRCHDV